VFFGAPMPHGVLQSANRQYTPAFRALRHAKPKSKSFYTTIANLDHLAALIRAGVLLTFNSQETIATVTPHINPDHPDIAYQLGRLLAVYDEAQDGAHDGQVGSGIVDRFFDAFMQRPAATMATVHRLHLHHAQKLRRVNPGKGRALNALVDSIIAHIDSETDLPSTLDVRQRSLFILGFHQQRAVRFAPRKDAAIAATESGNSSLDPTPEP
jgi:CRISPR-associated protein Csd1